MILNGDCLEELKKLPANSVDCLLTDPPYGITFMAKKWDKFSNPQKYQMWTEEWGREVYRVLKPGAFGLVFGAPRMVHRATCGLEDAGFEIRDRLLWMFLSGVPKGQDISKFIDKFFGFERPQGKEKMFADGGKASARKKIGDSLTKTVYAEEGKYIAGKGTIYETIAVSPEAKQWEGYRTNLKPFTEPIILIQKPKEGTFIDNILKWGVGGINIDDTRIPLNLENESDPRINDPEKNYKYTSEHENAAVNFFGKNGVRAEHIQQLYDMKGRYPGNIIIDEMMAELLDMISGIEKAGKLKLNKDVDREIPKDGKPFNSKNSGFFTEEHMKKGVSNFGDGGGMSKFFKNVKKWCDPVKVVYGGKGFKRSFEHFNLRDGGGMSKFFYCPKASTAEKERGLEHLEGKPRDNSRKGDPANPYNRNHEVKNFHPTVKPIKLLCYLLRLIKPPTRCPVVLDPFAGSGSIGLAARIENCEPILIEKNPDYITLITGRMDVDITEFQDSTDSVVEPEIRGQLSLYDYDW